MPPKRPLTRKRQTKISFSPAAKPSPKASKAFATSDSEDNEPSPSRPSKRLRLDREINKGMKMGMPVQLNKRGMFGSSDVEDDSSSFSSSRSLSQEESDNKVTVISPEKSNKGKKAQPKKGRKQATPENGSEEEIQVVEEQKFLRKSSRGKKTHKEASPEEDGEEVVEVVKPRKSRGKKARKEPTPEEDDEDLVVEVIQPKKTRTRSSRRQATPVENSEEEIEEEIQPKKTRTGKSRRQATPEEEEEEEEEELQPTRNKRRLKSRLRASTPDDNSSGHEEDEENNEQDAEDVDEKNELKEELAFLQSSPVQDRGKLRSTKSKPKSDREKALEALKKRRSGMNTNEPSPSITTPGRKKPVIIDSEGDSDSELEIIPEEEPDDLVDEEEDEDEDDEEEDVEDDEVGTNAHDVFRETNEDNEFIDDDNEGILGAPADDDAPRLPIAFTSLSTAKPRDLFKYAIEWMVQKKINPAFPSTDEIYTLAFRKLDDEVKGLASSKFHSSVWTADFTRAIKERPDFLVNEIGMGMRDVMEAHCEACNRKNHTATWEVALTGQPYHKETLEPIADESDDENDNDGNDSDSSSTFSALSSRASDDEAALNGEKPTYDALGERIPPESKTFTLGSTCKANAQVAHTLYHWRYHLNSWVMDHLDRKGHCTVEKLVKRDKQSERKRNKYANKIVDEMEKSGEIKKLHKLYKDQVDYALEASNEYKRGWGRRGG